MSADSFSVLPGDGSTECDSQGGGIAIRVYAYANRGRRKHTEDVLANEWEPGARGQAFVGVLNGHGGDEAALYTKEHLCSNTNSFKGFEVNC